MSVLVTLLRWFLAYGNPSSRIRDFGMWPLGTRLVQSWSDTIQFPNGIRMQGDPGDQLGRIIFFYGSATSYPWEPVTTRLLEALAKNATGALVAGAHLGYMVLAARRALPKDREVITCEPVSYLRKATENNVQLNQGLGPVRIVPAALGDREGHAQITIDNLKSKLTDGGDLATEEVSVTTIDTLTETVKPSLVLLDVEGYERKALQGAHNLLHSGAVTDIIFEVSRRTTTDPSDLSRIEEMLTGWAFYRIEEGEEIVSVWTVPAIIRLQKLPNLGMDNFPGRYHNVYATTRTEEDLAKEVPTVRIDS